MSAPDAPVILTVTLTTWEAAVVAKAAAESDRTPDEWATAAVVTDAEMFDAVGMQPAKRPRATTPGGG